jgi:ParB family chromosome partitioning protein
MNAARGVLSVPIAEIAIGERIGFFHPDHAAGLGASMAKNGQHVPVQLRRNGNRGAKPWSLVAGLHRIRGAELISWTRIDAIQVADASSDEATLLRLELSENLDHRAPLPIERAIFIATRARIEEAAEHGDFAGEAPHLRAAKARWAREKPDREAAELSEENASATVGGRIGWRERTAAAFGCSLRTFERHLALYRAVVEPHPRELIEQLNRHPLADSFANLFRIVQRQSPPARLRAIEVMLERPDLTTIDAVFVAAGFASSKGNRPASDDFKERALSNVGRLNLREKKEFAVDFLRSSPRSVWNEMLQVARERGWA